jgi:hypothetical protein
MTISSRTPEGRPNRCPVCRRRLRLSPSWPSADAPCPHCGSLVWFPTANALWKTAGPPTSPDFTLDDFRQQLEQLKRMGQTAEVLAGPEALGELRRVRGMLDAMTRKERASPDILNLPRCRRIAVGAGVPSQEVEQFLGQFQQVRELMRQMAQMSPWRKDSA